MDRTTSRHHGCQVIGRNTCRTNAIAGASVGTVAGADTAHGIICIRFGRAMWTGGLNRLHHAGNGRVELGGLLVLRVTQVMLSVTQIILPFTQIILSVLLGGWSLR